VPDSIEGREVLRVGDVSHLTCTLYTVHIKQSSCAAPSCCTRVFSSSSFDALRVFLTYRDGGVDREDLQSLSISLQNATQTTRHDSCLAKLHRNCERAGDRAAAGCLGTDEDAVLQIAVIGRASEEGRGYRERNASAINVSHAGCRPSSYSRLRPVSMLSLNTLYGRTHLSTSSRRALSEAKVVSLGMSHIRVSSWFLPCNPVVLPAKMISKLGTAFWTPCISMRKGRSTPLSGTTVKEHEGRAYAPFASDVR